MPKTAMASSWQDEPLERWTRTGYERGNPQAVFDGDLDGFLEAGIRWRRGAEKAAEN